jgi:hypothetical protein
LIRKRSPGYQLAIKFLVDTYRRLVEIDLAHNNIKPAQANLVRIGQVLGAEEPDGGVRAVRALAKAQMGDCEGALALLPNAQRGDEPDTAYSIGLVYAVVASRRPDALADHAAESVRQLRVAHERDFFRIAWNCGLLARDRRLDVLRNRDDFQALLTDIPFPSDPFAP